MKYVTINRQEMYFLFCWRSSRAHFGALAQSYLQVIETRPHQHYVVERPQVRGDKQEVVLILHVGQV